MVALAGEVNCTCGQVLIGQDGRPLVESDRDQVLCARCGAGWDKKTVLAARDDRACVVMQRCPKGCKSKMIKTAGRMGSPGGMRCPLCGARRSFDKT
jgi:hypothetical protein